MELAVGCDRHRLVTITGSEECPAWTRFIRFVGDIVVDATIRGLKVTMAWRVFLVHRADIYGFQKKNGCTLRLSPEIRALLAKATPRTYASAIKHYERVPTEVVLERLAARAFCRNLTKGQLENLTKMAGLPAAATFSVPGAGKTTEALALFASTSDPGDRLLVVAPKNAFGAWDEQLAECLGIGGAGGFVRLRGGVTRVRSLLAAHPQYMIVTYSQMPFIVDAITEELSRYESYMFLDESHRIKGGRGGAWCDAVLDVAALPKRKLILSGTPMPQSSRDLVPQFGFLYPDKPVDEDNVIETIRPVFVRTTQGELDIPPVERKIISLDMTLAQAAVYDTLRSEAMRELAGMTRSSRRTLRMIGRCSIRLLQFASNPALLATSLRHAFDQQIGRLLLQGDGPKVEYACRRARQLASEGKKVIIWSSFVQNVEIIASMLEDIGAGFIHGGVDAGSDEEEDTREGKIRRFHDDPSMMALVANPAACSEGISLHRVCHNAIYVDRSFNAAQYLQSEDRIHRLGLQADQHPVVEILECRGTIDEVVSHRLEQKVSRMAEALNDRSLSISAGLFDPDLEIDEGLSDDDVKAICTYFGLGEGNDD